MLSEQIGIESLRTTSDSFGQPEEILFNQLGVGIEQSLEFVLRDSRSSRALLVPQSNHGTYQALRSALRLAGGGLVLDC